MINEIIKKEVLVTLISFKFAVTFVLCTLAILISIYISMLDYKFKLNEYNQSFATGKEVYQAYSSWEELGRNGIRIVMKPSILSIFCSGITKHTGQVYTVSTLASPIPSVSEFGQNPIIGIFGTLDLTFIVGNIISLIVILFTYDLVCGEKEMGTLRLALSNPISRIQLISGKACGLFACLYISFIIPLLLGLLIMGVGMELTLNLQEAMRFSLILIVFTLHIIFFFALGAFISALTERSSSSFLILLSLWAIMLFIIPKISGIIANQISPIPSVQEIQYRRLTYFKEYTNKLNQGTSELTRSITAGQITLDQFDTKHRMLREKLANEMREDNEKLDEYLYNKQLQLGKATMLLSRFSPITSMNYSTMELAQTSFQHTQQFLESIKLYQAKFITTINDQAKKEKLVFRILQGDDNKKIDLQELPPFIYNGESLESSVIRALPDVLLLSIASVILIALAYYSFAKYDPR